MAPWSIFDYTNVGMYTPISILFPLSVILETKMVNFPGEIELLSSTKWHRTWHAFTSRSVISESSLSIQFIAI